MYFLIHNKITSVRIQSADISTEDLDQVVSALDAELSVQRANIAMANCHHYLSGDKSAQTLTSENVASNTASKPERSYPSPKENHDHHAASEGSAARIPPPRPPPPKLRGPSLIYKPNISSSSISKANPKIALNNSVASSSAASQSSNDSRANAARDIEDEIGLLETLIGSMQKEVEDKQNCFKQDMQDLSSKFQDGICIPPMPRKI